MANTPFRTSTVDRDTLAYALGLSKQYLAKLARDGVIPHPVDGRYPVAAIPRYLTWYRENNPTPESPPNSLGVARYNLSRAMADKATRAAAWQAANLIPVAAFRRTWEAARRAIAARLLVVPGEVAPLLAATDDAVAAQAIVEEAIHRAMGEISSAEVETR